jgi:hypothetical protein
MTTTETIGSFKRRPLGSAPESRSDSEHQIRQIRPIQRCDRCQPKHLYRIHRWPYEWAPTLLRLYPYICSKCGLRGLMFGRYSPFNWRWRTVRIRIIFPLSQKAAVLNDPRHPSDRPGLVRECQFWVAAWRERRDLG